MTPVPQELKSYLTKIEALASDAKYDEALTQLDKLIEAYPREPRVLASRAFVFSHQGSRGKAVLDWSQAISLSKTEPHYYYMRGIELFALKKYEDAVLDFSKVIELCDFHSSDYYRLGALFFRADAQVHLGNFALAKHDCMLIPDKMRTWTDGIRTKEDILDECKRGSP
jgi:tetratricopeptide (TPR) repeat protein